MKQTKHLLLLILLLLPLTSAADELPDLGESSATILSTKEEKRLGKEFIKEVREQFPIIFDPIINNYIQNIGDTLVAHTKNQKRKFHFFVVDDPSINAFAGPAAYIGINSGVITTAGSESELAAVMAHEIAHVTQHHIERLIAKYKTTQLTTMASTLAAILIGATSHSSSLNNIASGTVMASMGGAMQQMINFTREHEIEADNIGMKILADAGFDPSAVPNFFERMQRSQYNYINETPKFLLTHLVTSERIAETKNRANRYSFKNSRLQDTFYLIQARTQILTAANLLDTIKSLQIKITQKTSKNLTALQYGYALALYKNQQIAKAVAIVNELQKINPNELLFQMLAAELALANKQSDYPLQLLKTAYENHANYYPLILQYGHALIATRQIDLACDFIRSKIRLYPEDANLYRLLAAAYAKKKQKADAYLAKAKAYELDGYNREAGILLQQALKTTKLSANNRAIINTRIEQLKKMEKEL